MAGFAFIPLVLIVVLAMLAIPDAERLSVLATIGVIAIAAAIPLALVWLDYKSGAEILWRDSRPKVRTLCWFVFFLVVCVYLLSLDRTGDLPPALEFEVVVIAAALGGLVLNAGVSSGLPCESLRREFIAVAQKFIVVVILGIIFPPIMLFVDFFGGVDIMSFEPGNPSGWVLGPLFLFGMFSFFASVSLFIVALVDLVYAMRGAGARRRGGMVRAMRARTRMLLEADRLVVDSLEDASPGGWRGVRLSWVRWHQMKAWVGSVFVCGRHAGPSGPCCSMACL